MKLTCIYKVLLKLMFIRFFKNFCFTVDAVTPNSKLPPVASGAKNCVPTVSSSQVAPLPPPTRTTAPLNVPCSTNTTTTLSSSPATSPPNLRHSSYSSSNDTHHHSNTRAAAETIKTATRTPDPVMATTPTKVS